MTIMLSTLELALKDGVGLNSTEKKLNVIVY